MVGRNFIASSVGLLAKLEETNALHIVATDIGTATPLPGARVRAYKYQNQLLGETTSDGNGFAVMKLDNRPFLVTAQSGDDTGYLRLNSASALSLSQFDVGGEAVKKRVLRAQSTGSAASGGPGTRFS